MKNEQAILLVNPSWQRRTGAWLHVQQADQPQLIFLSLHYDDIIISTMSSSTFVTRVKSRYYFVAFGSPPPPPPSRLFKPVVPSLPPLKLGCFQPRAGSNLLGTGFPSTTIFDGLYARKPRSCRSWFLIESRCEFTRTGRND